MVTEERTIPRISIDEQIDEVRREIAMRQGAYPKFVERGVVTQAKADLQMERIEAALRTLLWLKDNKDRIKSLFAGGQP